MRCLPDFYRGRRVLITGHTGFKGAWLALTLRHMGAEVMGYSLPPDQQPSLFALAQVGDRIRSREGDVRDQRALESCIADFSPEIVLHNAAQALVRRSYRDPLETFSTNIMGTANVLDAARRTTSIRSVLVVTTDKCYRNRERRRPYSEEEELGGHDPYSTSKACAELVTSSYRDSYFSGAGGPAVATARAGNVLGGGDWSEDRIVPDIVRALTRGEPVNLRSPDSVRPWQHVLDALHGYLLLAAQLCQADGRQYAEPWNFGPADEGTLTVRELATRFVKVWGKGEIRSVPSEGAPHEAVLLCLDAGKARQRLGWSSLLDNSETLEWTAAWYKRVVLENQPAFDVTAEQIENFLKRASTDAAQRTVSIGAH